MRKLFENNWYNLYNQEFFHYSWKKFIDEKTKIVGIGGCFNSNFLNFLKLSGLNIFDSTWGLHYNPSTILNELYKIFNKEKSNTLYWNTKDKNNNNILLDALRHPFYEFNEKDFLKKDKIISEDLEKSLTNSNAILVSFALAEVWEQKVDDRWIIINRTPPHDVLMNNKKNFRHRNLTVLECKKYIKEIIRLIHNFNKDINIVFMVIPIPLKTSYRNMHPKISDILTKSRLLVALDEIFEENKSDKNIIYFPIYEIFQYFGEKENFFQIDNRHLKADVYLKIGKMFIDFFVKDRTFIININNKSFNVKQISV